MVRDSTKWLEKTMVTTSPNSASYLKGESLGATQHHTSKCSHVSSPSHCQVDSSYVFIDFHANIPPQSSLNY